MAGSDGSSSLACEIRLLKLGRPHGSLIATFSVQKVTSIMDQAGVKGWMDGSSVPVLRPQGCRAVDSFTSHFNSLMQPSDTLDGLEKDCDWHELNHLAILGAAVCWVLSVDRAG